MEDFSAEQERLQSASGRKENWQRWGTYLPERQWGTVREDTSGTGEVWKAFSHEMAGYRAYRWGEDGLLGWTDRECRLCFYTALWNGNDPVLKERLFGLGNTEGNHGEDVKELFYYLDATPTHSYAKALYKYPQRAFPYEQLRAENKRRGLNELEYELLDTGVFDEDRYFDVEIEYAKADVEDVLIRITCSNRGPDTASLVVLPSLVFRNTWSWPTPDGWNDRRPELQRSGDDVTAEHETLGTFRFQPLSGPATVSPEAVLFTENESNSARTCEGGGGQWSKDAFQRYVVDGGRDAVKPDARGTKCAFLFRLEIPSHQAKTIYMRLVRVKDMQDVPSLISLANAEQVFLQRVAEADRFYEDHIPREATAQEKLVARQAYAGLLWSKQFYYFVAENWLREAPSSPQRQERADNWKHLFCRDVLSMPDKWEYPWFASWDLAFHMLPMAALDPEFAKHQLLLLLREWYLHPNGQMPAYEFGFGDVNPPVHAWAVWHVYQMGASNGDTGDLDFLERAFQKLMLNFNWWVNRNDEKGLNIFTGGFLGLDNIGVFDRSEPLPSGVILKQADATAWMGLYCSCMLQTALELAKHRSRAYEDIASKFFEHYISLIDAMNFLGGSGLWDEEEGFYFDLLATEGKPSEPMKVRSAVGLAPLFALCVLKHKTLEGLDAFKKRMQWFIDHKPGLAAHIREAQTDDEAGSHWISITPHERFKRIMRRVLDESEFLSSHGLRALSRAHLDDPFKTTLGDKEFTVKYVPAEGDSLLFGGNSNWRGPVWFPINMLFVNAMERYDLVLNDDYKLECPTGSGQMMSLVEVGAEVSRRLISLFLPDDTGKRPCHGAEHRYAVDPFWKNLVLFNEYFSGDDGRGVGATHQTGWTALVAILIRGIHTPENARNERQ